MQSTMGVWRTVCLPLLKGLLISFVEQFTAELRLEGWNGILLDGEVGAKETIMKLVSELGLRFESTFCME